MSEKTSKKSSRKGKKSTNLPSTSSTPDNAQPVIFDEEELERQYQTYKKQFDDWTTKNKGLVSEQSFNNYVEQFKKWEKEIDARRKYMKSRKELAKREKSSTESTGNVSPANSSAAAPGSDNIAFDPSAAMSPYSMMMMMASMMMPFVMMNPAAEPVAASMPAPPVARKDKQLAPVFSPNSISAAPVVYNNNQPPMLPPLPNNSFPQPPPPLQRWPNYAPVASGPSAAAPPIDSRHRYADYDREQRGQRSNGRCFRNNNGADSFDGGSFARKSESPAAPEGDVWYRRYRRLAEETEQPWVRGAPPSLDNGRVANGIPQQFGGTSGFDPIFRGTNYEPLRRGPEPWTQSGLGANDFSMRRRDGQQRRF